MNTKLSLNTFGSEALAVMKRFPASMTALGMLTLCILYFIHYKTFSGVLTFYLATSFVLNLLFALMSEEAQTPKSKWGVSIAQMVLNVLLAVDCLAINAQETPGTALLLGNGAAVAALLLCLVPLPFWKEKDDRASWNFGHQLLLSLFFGYLVGTIMCSGLMALYGGILILFSLSWDYEVGGIIAALTYVTLPLLLTLIRLPKGEAKHQTEVPENRFMLGAVRYLFLPLTALHMGVLYVYLLRILMQMELPKGMITYLVSSLMGDIIVLRIVLYPYLHLTHRAMERRLMRLLPLLALPLVGLMSVAIAHRIAEYGITWPRLYVILLNLWFYAVCLILGLRRQGQVRWLPLSLSALLLLSSSQPLNFVEVARLVRLRSAERLLRQYHTDGKPMDKEAFLSLLNTIPEKERRQLYDDIEYLFDNHASTDNTMLQAHFDKKRFVLHAYDEAADPIDITDPSITLAPYETPIIHVIPQGCHRIRTFESLNTEFRPLGQGVFEIKVDSLAPARMEPGRFDYETPETYTLRVGQSDTMIVVHRAYIPDSTTESTGTLAGYLFYP